MEEQADLERDEVKENKIYILEQLSKPDSMGTEKGWLRGFRRRCRSFRRIKGLLSYEF